VPFSSLKILICRKYSYQKLTQFSQGYNVIDATACNTHGFLSRDICVPSSQQYRTIWKNVSLPLPWNTHIAGSIPFKTNSFLTENNVLNASASNSDGFLLRDTCACST
jgi:hypothetical protein